MPNSTPTSKPQPSKTAKPAQASATRSAPRKVKSKPQASTRQIFKDFASI